MSQLDQRQEQGEAISRLVLVVDDEEPFRWLLTAILEDAGHRCLAADGLLQARELLSGAPVECILLDVSMPDGGGLAFLRELHRDRGAVAVVMVTGHHDPDLAREAREAGALGWLVKPFRAQEVRRAVDDAITRRAAGS
jgi:DNA-binding NtrC family response regulator